MRILLVDDHPMFLEAFQSLLTVRGLNIVGTAKNGFEALAMTRQISPDVVIMDHLMPECDGLEATRLIKKEMPEVKIVILSACDDNEILYDAIRSGASGFLLKILTIDQFLNLLNNLEKGEPALSPGKANLLLQEFARRDQKTESSPTKEETPRCSLNQRQIRILSMVSQGLTYKEIGTAFYLSDRTIKYHMREICQRLQAKNRHQGIEKARRLGILSDE